MKNSEVRYHYRRNKWKEKKKLFPLSRHNFWWVIHNCISHPLLGVNPSDKTIWFHDWTSKKLNIKKSLVKSPNPNITNKRTWIWHNVIGHILIGIRPNTRSFKYHDYTAEAMNVSDWL